WANHQHALRNTSTYLDELLRFAQELHHFLDLFLGLSNAGNIIKGNSRPVTIINITCPAAPETKNIVTTPLHLPEPPTEDPQQKQERGQRQGDTKESIPGRLVRRVKLKSRQLLFSQPIVRKGFH